MNEKPEVTLDELRENLTNKPQFDIDLAQTQVWLIGKDVQRSVEDAIHQLELGSTLATEKLALITETQLPTLKKVAELMSLVSFYNSSIGKSFMTKLLQDNLVQHRIVSED
jgi:hypothetical protein